MKSYFLIEYKKILLRIKLVLLTRIWGGWCCDSYLCTFTIHIYYSIQHLRQVTSCYTLAFPVHEELEVTLQLQRSRVKPCTPVCVR